MTPGQIRKNWHASARAWFRWSEKATKKSDKRKAENKMWESLLHAISGL